MTAPLPLNPENAWAAFLAALEALPGLALLARTAPLEVVHANARARDAISVDPAPVLDSAAAALEGPAPGASVLLLFEQPDGRTCALIVICSRDPAAARHQQAAAAWQLTDRQGEILQLLLAGASNKEVAQAASCSIKTVEKHVGAIFRKARVATRTELMAAALRPDDAGRVHPHDLRR